jgi:pimeloyl-ACP methyl ester carboxylesterase
MDESISLEEIDDADVASASSAASSSSSAGRDDLRGRFAALAQRGRDGAWSAVSGMQRLAALYFAQTGLIFPGRRTQGLEIARVEPPVDAELLTVTTSCDQTLAALFGPAADAHGSVLPDAATRPTIVFFYGNAQFLADRHLMHLFRGLRNIGVNVLIPEYVGYGMSTGDACEAGCYATADAAYAYLLSRRDVDSSRIVVCGASLGGAVAIDLASRDPRVAGLITLITFTSMPDMAKVVQPSVPIWRFIRHKFESEQKMPRVTCPALIIHSTGDALVPYGMADRLAAACRGPVSRLKIEGAGHSSVEMLEGGGGLIYEAITEFMKRV